MFAAAAVKEEIETALEQLDQQGIGYEILFLDAPDDGADAPLQRDPPPPSHAALRRASPPGRLLPVERQILQPLQERADYTINTALLSTAAE